MTHSTIKAHSVARSLVLKCGVRPDLIGCTFLISAVELRASGMLSFSDIYGEIAREFSVSHKSVSRDIAYAVSQADGLCGVLCEVLDIRLTPNQLYNSLVISYLAVILNVKLEMPHTEPMECLSC